MGEKLPLSVPGRGRGGVIDEERR